MFDMLLKEEGVKPQKHYFPFSQCFTSPLTAANALC